MNSTTECKFDYSWFPADKPQVDTYKQLPLIYEYTVKANAKRVLEIGVGDYGISTWTFLKALEKTNGHLVSIDINPTCESFYNSLRWTFTCADSANYYAKGRFDVILIDSSHEPVGTKMELFKYVPLINPGGYLFMHDTEDERVKLPLNEYIDFNHNLEFILSQDTESQMSIYRKL